MVSAIVYCRLSLAADDLGGNLYLNFILISAIEFPAIASAIYFCNKFGRKKTVSFANLIASISIMTLVFLPSGGKMKYGRLALGIFGKFCITVSFDAVYTWSIELFSTELRGKGMGFLQVFSRIGAASSPFISKGLKALHHSAPFITMGSLGITSFLIQVTLPETNNVPMKETND